MSETKHTPGPWVLRETDEGHEIRMGTAIGSRRYLAHHVLRWEHGCVDGECDSEEQIEEAEATAHLIAAAPDLLAALEELVAVREKHSTTTSQRDGSDGRYARAREAIKKARGAA